MLDGQGLDLEAMAGGALGRDDAAALQHRRQLAVLGSLQPFLRGLEPAGEPDGSSGSSRQQPWTPADAEAERQSAAALIARCRQLLDVMPTSAAQDEALLAAGGQQLSPRLRLAVTARLERKHLLHTAIAVLQRYLAQT